MSGKPDKKPSESKPEVTPAKPASPRAAAPKSATKGAALPDAALVNDGEEGSAAPAPARSRMAAWIPSTRRGWAIAGTAAFSLVIVSGVAVFSLYRMRTPAPPAIVAVAGPAAVVDGATVTVAGRTLRLDGITAPPASLVCRDGAWKYRCGDDARRALETAIGRGSVDCVARPTDAATCRNEQGADIAALQVQNGWAVVDLHQSSRYFVEQARAQQESRGLWRNDFAHPETWRLAAQQSK
jgi:endonuclease YncB( thermonuclease family)